MIASAAGPARGFRRGPSDPARRTRDEALRSIQIRNSRAFSAVAEQGLSIYSQPMANRRSFTSWATGITLCLMGAFFAFAGSTDASASTKQGDAAAVSALGAKRQVIMLGLRRRGKPQVLAAQVSNPASSNYRKFLTCLLYTSPSPRDGLLSRMPSSA